MCPAAQQQAWRLVVQEVWCRPHGTHAVHSACSACWRHMPCLLFFCPGHTASVIVAVETAFGGGAMTLMQASLAAKAAHVGSCVMLHASSLDETFFVAKCCTSEKKPSAADPGCATHWKHTNTQLCFHKHSGDIQIVHTQAQTAYKSYTTSAACHDFT